MYKLNLPVTSNHFRVSIFYEIYVSPYLTVGKNVAICSEKSVFCFSIAFQYFFRTIVVQQSSQGWS